MYENTVHDVCDSLEPAMWMPIGSTRFIGRVIDLAHLIHMNERIKNLSAHTRKSSTHWETFALMTTWGCCYRNDRTRMSSDRCGNTRKSQSIGGNCGHAIFNTCHRRKISSCQEFLSLKLPHLTTQLVPTQILTPQSSIVQQCLCQCPN